jgi:hypothetical protein
VPAGDADRASPRRRGRHAAVDRVGENCGILAVVIRAFLGWSMDESHKWGLPRYVTLLVVLTSHLVLIVVLVMASRTGGFISSPTPPIELLYLPPMTLPKVRSENRAPRRLGGDLAITIAPPALASSSPSASPPAPSSDGTGKGVDWAAEARRALHAFEIRTHQPVDSMSVSGAPGDDPWRRLAQHHAGEQVKTANGDWIVWINANCYQVASSGTGAYPPGAAPLRTFCPGQSGAPGAAPIDPGSANAR